VGKTESKHNVNDHWGTPEDVWGPMVEHFGTPGLDPFWNPNSKVPHRKAFTDWTHLDDPRGPCTFWTSPDGTQEVPWDMRHALVDGGEDGFVQSWDDRGLVYVNGPFSRAAEYLDKCSQEGDEVIFLFKANMNAKYVHKYVRPCDAVAFFDHRLKYQGAQHQATFHTALGYWGHRPGLFQKAYDHTAWVVRNPLAID
jgi:hypothetical protein